VVERLRQLTGSKLVDIAGQHDGAAWLRCDWLRLRLWLLAPRSVALLRLLPVARDLGVTDSARERLGLLAVARQLLLVHDHRVVAASPTPVAELVQGRIAVHLTAAEIDDVVLVPVVAHRWLPSTGTTLSAGAQDEVVAAHDLDHAALGRALWTPGRERVA